MKFVLSRQALAMVASAAMAVTTVSVVYAQQEAASAPAASASVAQAPVEAASGATAAASAPAISVLPGYPTPPEIAARGYLLIDVTAGNQLLAAKELDTLMEPASLTKLMTAYLVFDALKSGKITLEQTFTVSEKAWKLPGSRMFLEPRSQVKVEDLIKGMIVQSGNDATMTLAEGLAGSEEAFVQRMNDTAQTLGMTRTGYRNPEGLTAQGHVTTARDMAILATRLLKDFPEYVGYYAIKEYHYPGTPVANGINRNALLFRDPTVDGLKTGHTDAAGYNLIATAKRTFPNMPEGRRLLAIVFGTASDAARANETQKLLNWGYTAFDGVQLYAPNQAIVQAKLYKGATSEVGLGLAQGLAVAVPAGKGGEVSTKIERPDPLIAPVAQGQPVGSIQVIFNNQAIINTPLTALSTVEQAGFFGRLWDSLMLWFKGFSGK